MKSSVVYRDQVNSLSAWFHAWNECEQTVALCSILKKTSPSQALFLIHILEQNILGNNQLAALEEEANDPDFIRTLHSLPHDQAVRHLLTHLPLLRTGNPEAKMEFLKILPEVLTQTIRQGALMDECRQLLSFLLIHPAVSAEERAQYKLCLSQLDEPHEAVYRHRPHELDMRPLGQVPGWDCAGSRDSGIVANLSPRSSLGKVNGFTPLHSTLSAPPTLQSHTSPNDDRLNLLSANPHMTVKRTKSLTPPINGQNGHFQQYTGVQHSSDWALQQSSMQQSAEFSSLSPQSSGSSSGSGSEHHDDFSKNQFTPGTATASGMEDVPAWLKSLRLHKYAHLFQKLSYDQMMEVSEEWLESQKVTKGARNKILLSIKKLQERQATLRALEKDVMEGRNLRQALNEIKLLLVTPFRAYSGAKTSTPTTPNTPTAPGTPTGPEADTSIAEGDLPGQFTRILGKVCTQILVSRHLEDEGVNLYLQLLERCMNHEAFTPKQIKLLSSWALQIQKIWYPGQKFNTDKARKNWGGCTFPISTGSRAARQLAVKPMKPVAPWPLQQMKPRTPIFLAPPTHPALTKHNSLNSYMLQQSMQESAKRQLERTHSAPGCWGAGNLSLAQEPQIGQEMVGDPDINARLDSLCLRMTEHALGGQDVADRGSTF